MIGGTDIVLWVREDISAADVILRTVRRHWPKSLFQDADDPSPPTENTEDRVAVPAGPEYFVYRDEQAALSWDKHGAIPENSDSMLHVVLGVRRRPSAGLRSLTLVCDRREGEMGSIIDEIEARFRDLAEHPLER